ncbi:MAG TPA: hypothetical protein VN982_01655 [Candidatus Dormibacteraeota bacterium]|nr:hypothetical protein [Candidatus Dormibacteraeota bacterium]
MGELISKKELYALYDFSFAWREEASFAEFLRLRRICKTDAFLLGRDILGDDFHEKPHGVWRDFFPKLSPVGLNPGYSLEDLKRWLGAQDPVKTFNLIASRSAYKSWFARRWMVTAVCCCPSLKILLCTETRPLARDFVRHLRGTFEVHGEGTRFNWLMPEMCIKPDDGSSLILENPFDHLKLIGATVEATAMDVSSAGRRCHCLHYDDPVSNLTTANEIQRQASIDKHDLLNKLVEPGGYITMCSTPWHMEDLTAALVTRADETEDGSAKYRIDPAWTVKVDAKHKELTQLVEEDVELLFPSRLSWKFLQKEVRASKSNGYRFFRMQNLCEFLPTDLNEIKLHFDPDVLTRACIPQSAVPAGDNIISVDVAYSMSARADLTSIGIVRMHENSANEKCMCVLDIEADRLRGSELAHRLVMLTRQYNPKVVLIEQGPTSDSLRTQINLIGAKYECSVPVYFVQPSNVKNAKFLRIKELELLLSVGRLKFASSAYVDALFAELQKLDGAVSSGRKKDDRADCLSQIATTFRIYAATPNKNKTPAENEDEMEKMRKQAEKRAQYERTFGGQNYQPKAPDAPTLQQKSTDPRWATALKILPPGFRL